MFWLNGFINIKFDKADEGRKSYCSLLHAFVSLAGSDSTRKASPEILLAAPPAVIGTASVIEYGGTVSNPGEKLTFTKGTLTMKLNLDRMIEFYNGFSKFSWKLICLRLVRDVPCDIRVEDFCLVLQR